VSPAKETDSLGIIPGLSSFRETVGIILDRAAKLFAPDRFQKAISQVTFRISHAMVVSAI
jgi:hypothetical protein